MKVLPHAAQCSREEGPVCAAIGFFDGLHLGHQQVIRRALAEAQELRGQAVVITFDRHPLTIVNPLRAPPLIYRLEKKLHLLESLGCTTVLLLPFDEALSRVMAVDFIRSLGHDFGKLASLSVGSNFHFGYQRSGNMEWLQQWGSKMRFRVNGVPPVTFEGEPISSTRIREAIQLGRFAEASQMLGRPYTLHGLVLRGDQIGRTLGFPTANVDADGLVTPPGGVYAAWAWLANRKYPAVVNYGHRPTLARSRPQRQMEAHLLDFSGDVYGREMGLEFLVKLREETRFASREQLQNQIATDIQSAQSHFAAR